MRHLTSLRQLETLTFGSTEVGDQGLKQITGLKNLRWLEFGHNKRITDAGLAAIRDLTQLRRLYLQRTRITDAGLIYLDRLTEMRMLMLPEGVTDAGIEHLKRMTKADVPGNQRLTDHGQRNLCSQRNEGHERPLSHQHKGRGRWARNNGSLHKLTMLNLSGSKITNAGTRHLEGLSELRTLVLEHTAISDACIGSLSKIDKLSFILLGGTRVTGQGGQEMRKKLPKLQVEFR